MQTNNTEQMRQFERDHHAQHELKNRHTQQEWHDSNREGTTGMVITVERIGAQPGVAHGNFHDREVEHGYTDLSVTRRSTQVRRADKCNYSCNT